MLKCAVAFLPVSSDCEVTIQALQDARALLPEECRTGARLNFRGNGFGGTMAHVVVLILAGRALSDVECLAVVRQALQPDPDRRPKPPIRLVEVPDIAA